MSDDSYFYVCTLFSVLLLGESYSNIDPATRSSLGAKRFLLIFFCYSIEILCIIMIFFFSPFLSIFIFYDKKKSNI